MNSAKRTKTPKSTGGVSGCITSSILGMLEMKSGKRHGGGSAFFAVVAGLHWGADHPVEPVLMLVKLIKFSHIEHQVDDEQGYRHAYGKAGDVDKGEQSVFAEAPKGHFDKIAVHRN